MDSYKALTKNKNNNLVTSSSKPNYKEYHFKQPLQNC